MTGNALCVSTAFALRLFLPRPSRQSALRVSSVRPKDGSVSEMSGGIEARHRTANTRLEIFPELL